MPLPERPSIRSNRAVSTNHLPESPRRDTYNNFEPPMSRPAYGRSNTTFEGPTQIHRDNSPPSSQRMVRVPSDNLAMRQQRANLRPMSRVISNSDVFNDPSDDSPFYSNNTTNSPDRYFSERAASPAHSHGSGPSRTASYSTLNSMNGKKAPPPPPPSRAKKPPPPPPVMRSALSTSDVHYA